MENSKTALEKAQERWVERNKHRPPLPPGGGGDTFDPMEARVKVLEDAMGEIKSDLKALRTDMTSVRVDTAEMKGRVASLPTTWQLITLVFGILGGAFIILRFGLPHVAG